MTSKPIARAPDAPDIIQFPDPPPEEMTAYYKVNFPGYPGSLAVHFGNPDTTIITSEVAAALIPTTSYEGVRYPDLLISFNADPAANIARNGYLIPEQGKPPDFVLEVASKALAAAMRRSSGGTTPGWGFPNTGGLTPPAAVTTRLTSPATAW